MRRFSKQEDDFIREHYLMLTLGQLGDNLNREIGSIYGRMKLLNLIVPKEIKKQRQLKALNEAWKLGEKTRFKKGHTPANKGISPSAEVYEKLKPTMFKKGHEPFNTKYNGAISIRKDKCARAYKYIRLAKAKWELLHRDVWMKHNGPIPANHVIKFKDGNSMNCNIGNLYMVDRKQHMAETTIQRYPPEIKRAIRALAKIDKLTTNKKTKL